MKKALPYLQMSDNPTRLLGVCTEWSQKLEKPIFEFDLIHNHMLMNDNIRLVIWKRLLKTVSPFRLFKFLGQAQDKVQVDFEGGE